MYRNARIRATLLWHKYGHYPLNNVMYLFPNNNFIPFSHHHVHIVNKIMKLFVGKHQNQTRQADDTGRRYRLQLRDDLWFSPPLKLSQIVHLAAIFWSYRTLFGCLFARSDRKKLNLFPLKKVYC